MNAYSRRTDKDALRAYHLHRVTSQFDTTISPERRSAPSRPDAHDRACDSWGPTRRGASGHRVTSEILGAVKA